MSGCGWTARPSRKLCVAHSSNCKSLTTGIPQVREGRAPVKSLHASPLFSLFFSKYRYSLHKMELLHTLHDCFTKDDWAHRETNVFPLLTSAHADGRAERALVSISYVMAFRTATRSKCVPKRRLAPGHSPDVFTQPFAPKVLPRPMISDHEQGRNVTTPTLGGCFVTGSYPLFFIGLISGVSSFRYIPPDKAPLDLALSTLGNVLVLFRLSPMKIRRIVQVGT